MEAGPSGLRCIFTEMAIFAIRWSIHIWDCYTAQIKTTSDFNDTISGGLTTLLLQHCKFHSFCTYFVTYMNPEHVTDASCLASSVVLNKNNVRNCWICLNYMSIGISPEFCIYFCASAHTCMYDHQYCFFSSFCSYLWRLTLLNTQMKQMAKALLCMLSYWHLMMLQYINTLAFQNIKKEDMK